MEQMLATTDRAVTSCNVAGRLTEMAHMRPDAVAVAEPLKKYANGRRQYRTVTFRHLDDDSDRIAGGLRAMGVVPGMRLALLVRPSIDFVSLVFALFKVGAVTILIDPGLGRKNLIQCLEDAQPEGFIAIPLAQTVRKALQLTSRRFARAKINVTVGRRWFWGGKTLAQLRGDSEPIAECAKTSPDDPAAIIFTTGSTGPSKGVLYRHGNFARQVEEIRDQYGIQPGGVDLACFPLFGLFNGAWGVTTVIPDLDASRPAAVDPQKIIEAVQDWNVTQSFGSPAIWNKVGRYCEEHNIRLPTLRRVYSAGAPVPAHVLKRMQACIADDGEVHTPYGATEALPIASIGAAEVLNETWSQTETGAGVCVGSRFHGIEWRVIEINDGPIASIADAKPLPRGEIGELIVRGPVVTTEYVTRAECNPLAKIADLDGFWHRMGDVGYLDEQDRFWYCGRVAHRVRTKNGTLYTAPVEEIFNTHPKVFRSALVGVGPPGEQTAVLFYELSPIQAQGIKAGREQLQIISDLMELKAENPRLAEIELILPIERMPVDIRHNTKINREKLAVEATRFTQEVERANKKGL